MISKAEQDERAARERAHSLAHVTSCLENASRDDRDRPILYMITKNRKSATLAIQVFTIAMPDAVPVDITAAISVLTGLRYTDTHRAVFMNGAGTNMHQALLDGVAVALFGHGTANTITYRSM